MLERIREGQANAGLVRAFPASLQREAIIAVTALPACPQPLGSFSAQVAGETVVIPYRISHDPALINLSPLTDVRKQIIHCLLTRHHSGFVRQEHLTRIIRCNDIWIPPIVLLRQSTDPRETADGPSIWDQCAMSYTLLFSCSGNTSSKYSTLFTAT